MGTQGAVCAGAVRNLLRVRLPGAVADPDVAAARVRRLLCPSRHRVHARQLCRGAARGPDRGSLPQQRVDRDTRDRVLAAGDGIERLHAVAVRRAGIADLVRNDLCVPLRALHLLGLAAVLCYPELGYLRHLSRAASAACGGAHLLLLVADEGFFRRHRSVDGVRRHDRRLHPVGRFHPRRRAVGAARDLGACRAVLAVHLERVPVRPDPDRQPRADDHGCHGAVCHRDGIALEPDGGDRGDGAAAGVPGGAVRTEICDQRFAYLTGRTPKPGGEAMQRLAKLVMVATAALLAAAGTAAAQVTELRIGYQPSPIQDASIAMFETWGAKNGVKIVKVPNSYGVYVEKMTASLTSNSDQYDVIWHNDDWGQTWAHLLEPTDDVDANKYAEKWGMAPVVFANAQGQNTVVPMGQTFSVFFYRSDLVKPEEVPKTLAELVTLSKALQAASFLLSRS